MTTGDDVAGNRQLVVRTVVGTATASAGLAGPVPGLVAASLAPFLERALDFVSSRFYERRMLNAAETIGDAADSAGVVTDADFEDFIEKLIHDEPHAELLARVLAAAQDTALRDKRRALGRVLANAAKETGTTVDESFAVTRVIADLDPVHVRLLRLMSTMPAHLVRLAETQGLGQVRRWYPWSIAAADPGLAEAAWAALHVLEHHRLIDEVGKDLPTPVGQLQSEYEITGFGDYLIELLAAQDDIL